MRLLIVSNRLPVTGIKHGRGMEFRPSAGGLATGLESFLAHEKQSKAGFEYIWFGWPGLKIDKPHQDEVREELAAQNASPVFLTEQQISGFYNNFCNNLIWPLFHYFPSLALYNPTYWKEYQHVNQVFADEIVRAHQDGDIIWIHDYQLLLVPGLIRKQLPNAKIGFFLHTPFPHYEIYRLLPKQWREEILLSLLNADLIGFHTPEYANYFLQTVLQILGFEHEIDRIVVGERQISIKTFPIGIDVQKFGLTAKSPEVKEQRRALRKLWGNTKVILSLDRLDYSKGILNRLRGYELFLEQNPSWHTKITLALVIVPSRVEVDNYMEMKKQIEEVIGKINGKFGGLEWAPISYQFDHIHFDKLVALYQHSDVALVTPLRDGMNLVSKEYLASKTDATGVLILSELAGSAKELREAIQVNPNSIEEIAAGISDALAQPKEDQIKRNTLMLKRIKQYDVIRWAQDFTNTLIKVKREQESLALPLLDQTRNEIKEHFARSQARLLLFDYDGTLAPYVEDPTKAYPTEQVVQLLADLLKDKKNEIVIISGRDRTSLRRFFRSLNVNLSAEHGLYVKEPHQEWKMLRKFSDKWKSSFYHLLKMYVSRLPGSFTEEKDFSLAWHYRRADAEQGDKLAKELVNDLTNLTTNQGLRVLNGNKVIEVINSGIHKGTLAQYFLNKKDYDFVLAVGDDETDEDLFSALPTQAYSIKVGSRTTEARYTLPNSNAVIELLEKIKG